MNTPNENPSHHSTKQGVEKSPRTSCHKCGLVGVREMVRAGECVNVAACDRRRRGNEQRARRIADRNAPPGPPMSPDGTVHEPTKKAKAGK